MKHTKGPWIGSYEPMGTPEIIASDGESIGVCWPGQVSMERAEANRDFIVLACNTHYELLEALKPLLKYAKDTLSHGGRWCKQVDDAEKAIAKAEGRACPSPATT